MDMVFHFQGLKKAQNQIRSQNENRSKRQGPKMHFCPNKISIKLFLYREISIKLNGMTFIYLAILILSFIYQVIDWYACHTRHFLILFTSSDLYLFHLLHYLLLLLFFLFFLESLLREIIRFTWWTSDVVYHSTKKLPLV